MFIAALFTITNTCKQPVVIYGWMDKENVTYIYMYIYIYVSAIIKEWNLAIHNNMDGLWGHYGKWNKSNWKSKYHMLLLICGI